MLARCKHANYEAGPRVPMRYGSAPTEVCISCGSYRVALHVPGIWQPGPPPTEESDDT